MEIDQLLTEKRAQIIAIAAKHGANNVRIFGSVARQEADEKSDIELIHSFPEFPQSFQIQQWEFEPQWVFDCCLITQVAS